jgi:transposase
VFSRIGQDEREVLEYVPSSFKVIVHIRPKLSCRGCETILQVPMPSLPIERGRPGPGLISHVLVSKYCDHTPLHRQSGIYAREGVELERATLADWVGKAGIMLAPLAEAIARHVRAGPVLHADDTTVPVLAPGTGKTKTGRLWVALRDERPWGSAVPPAAVYLYSPDRRGIHAEALLGACRGFLHADAYTGFEKLYQSTLPGGVPPLVEVACWSHARRKIYDEYHETASPIARELLERIAALFAVESGISGQSPERRLAVRTEHAAPRLDELKTCLEVSLTRISGKSDLAKAIRYSLSRSTALTRYLHDGRLEMSNNAAERAMKPMATRESLCIPSSSIWKHWKLIISCKVTRSTFTPDRRHDGRCGKVRGENLERRAGHDLLGAKYTGFDQLAYPVAGNAALLRRLAQGQPGSILLRGLIGVNIADAPDGADPVCRPGLALSGRQSHPVEGGGDILVGPPARHAANDRQGLAGGSAS